MTTIVLPTSTVKPANELDQIMVTVPGRSDSNLSNVAIAGELCVPISIV